MQLTEAQKKVQSKLIPYWVALLKKNKVPENTIPLLISQIILESNWFTSNPYLKDNNPAGITWNTNYTKRPGATIGIKRPPKEGGNYVHFKDFDSAVIDYLRILNKNGSAGKPIEATTYTDYAQRLGKNGYYDLKLTTIESYAAGLKAQIKRMYNWFDIAALIKNNSSNIASLQILLIPIILGFLFFKK
jgi:flagellum-specific peptidoglycan hydrolase FlgJ